jgi:UDP-N-acetylglucosamine transferase subunit ALG13
MDEWVVSDNNTNNETVIAQVSDGDYQAKNIETQPFMSGDEYNSNIRKASVFVSHAGMGNIISARELQTPIIVINRQHKLGEHRNDHQLDGLKWMGKLDGVYTASTKEELFEHLNNIEQLKVANTNVVGSEQLTNYLADFISAGKC